MTWLMNIHYILFANTKVQHITEAELVGSNY